MNLWWNFCLDVVRHRLLAWTTIVSAPLGRLCSSMRMEHCAKQLNCGTASNKPSRSSLTKKSPHTASNTVWSHTSTLSAARSKKLPRGHGQPRRPFDQIIKWLFKNNFHPFSLFICIYLIFHVARLEFLNLPNNFLHFTKWNWKWLVRSDERIG